MSKDFKDFKNYYLDNVVLKLKNELSHSVNTRNLSSEEIVELTSGNCIGADLKALEHYHKWLIENYNITPKN